MNTEPRERAEIRRPSEKHITLWANDVQSVHGPWDFRLTFGRVLRADEEAFEVEQDATVYMSPQLAQRLIEVLQLNLKRYEDRFGKIHPPRDI